MSEYLSKDRVKMILSGASPEGRTSEQATVLPGPVPPQDALQVLTLAQRTAEEHLGAAARQAAKIRAGAQAAADQIDRDAQVYAANVRREAEKNLADARAATEQAAQAARATTDEAHRRAEVIVAEARSAADAIAATARGHADQLHQQARQRYEDSVGSLSTKREALQRQLEMLAQFDREYRDRLTSFMQGQLRALWVNSPQIDAQAGDAK